MTRVGVLGASGYTGLDLVRILSDHPNVSSLTLFSTQQSNTDYSSIYPHINLGLTIQSFDPRRSVDVDVLFTATPHAVTHSLIGQFVTANPRCKIIDLSADFRLKDVSLFEKIYGVAHEAPELLSQMVPGYTEKFRAEIQQAQYVSNPGCYPTATYLALAPLLASQSIDSIVVDAKSGMSGAGRSAKTGSLFCEASLTTTSYNLGKHRHQAEMESYSPCPVLFSPHTVPMSRGMLASCYVNLSTSLSAENLSTSLSAENLSQLYLEHYDSEPFVRVMDDSYNPSTHHVAGTNMCFVKPVWINSSTVAVVSVIDNLLKGASGQAIQNFNCMYGWDETIGLSQKALYI